MKTARIKNADSREKFNKALNESIKKALKKKGVKIII
jgi:hypothetical protein